MEELLAKLIVLGFKKYGNYYTYKDITLRPFHKTGTVYISCHRTTLRGLEVFPNYSKALPLIMELL